MCAAIWLVLPAGGYHALGSPQGAPYGPFTALVRLVYAVNPHHAGAFPSSHVAVDSPLALLLGVLAGGAADRGRLAIAIEAGPVKQGR